MMKAFGQSFLAGSSCNKTWLVTWLVKSSRQSFYIKKCLVGLMLPTIALGLAFDGWFGFCLSRIYIWGGMNDHNLSPSQRNSPRHIENENERQIAKLVER